LSVTVADTYEYDAFGNKINSTGTTPNNYLYRGEQFDSDLGLYYLRARYYNPIAGRFMSRDPEEHSPMDPNQLHKYLYVGGDPVNWWDPTGRAAQVEFQLTTIPGGTASAAALPELTAGAQQFAAAAQLYSGAAYLTAQDLLALIADVAYTKGIAKVLACGTVGLMASEIMSDYKVPYAEKVPISFALSYACGMFIPLPGPPPFPWKKF
jgi:RHS repeat-associated protein